MFVITGASGALFGRPVLDQLRRLVPGAGIVAGTRDPGSAQGLAQTGVEVRRVDFDDPASLKSAFAGATAVLVNGTNYGRQRRPVHGSVTAQGIPADLAGILLGVYRAFRAGWTGTPASDLATILQRAPRPALDAVSAVVSI